MRRLLPLAAVALALAGCGGGKTVSPTAGEVEGTLPTTTAKAVAGDAAEGKTLFASQGCGGCHTFKPANSGGKVGPDLDKLPDYAQQANQGSLEDFARESIVSPGSYVEKGFQNSMPDFGQTLSDKQVADLVAFLTQNPG